MTAPPRRTLSRAFACSLFLSASALLGCSGEPPVFATTPPTPQTVATSKPVPPAEYRLADLAARPQGSSVTLDKPSRLGILLDGARFIVEDGRARGVADASRSGITTVERIPQWLGSGFLFRSGSSLFTADTFDGRLKPLVTLPQSIARISFGPKSILVRGSEGERWAFELPQNGSPSGAQKESHVQDPWRPRAPGASTSRVPVSPIGLVDIEALGDGRVLAITEAGGAMMSTRRGEAWDDLTTKLSGAPADVLARGDDLFMTDDAGRAYRLDKSGAFQEIAQLPALQATPKTLDPRWHHGTPPRDLALAAGAKIDDETAVVAAAGDVARVDVRSGVIKSITQGRLPPNMTCEAMRVPYDVLLVCSAPGGPSIVASGVLSEQGLHIEKTFALDRPFYASDDGALVFAGSCAPDNVSTWAACARDPSGRWEEHNVESAALRSEKDVVLQGALEAVRWVPRVGKPPLAILVRTAVTVIDPTSGEPSVWQMEAVPTEIENIVMAVRPPERSGVNRIGGVTIDRRWEALPSGSLRGWLKPGRSIDVSPKGGFTFSPFLFETALVSGAAALTLTSDGRMWQTLDRGGTWAEVAAPPGKGSSMRSCSPVGCNLGIWHRVGWEQSPPEPKLSGEPADIPPTLQSPALPEITCTPAGEARESSLPQTSVSPEDMGLGATRTPFGMILPSGQSLSYRRSTFSRDLQDPPRSTRVTNESVPFVMIHNFRVEVAEIESAQGTINTLVVMGPSSSITTFRETFTFLAPFDPAGALRSPTLGVNAFAGAARAAGVSLAEVLAGESEGDGFVPVLPLDPGAPSDIVFTSHFSNGDIIGVMAGGASPSVRLIGARRVAVSPVSAVALAGGDIAMLTAPTDGSATVSRVLRVSATGVTDLGGIPIAPASDLQPANPDALAVGPQGALAILRTPSGGEPASIEDPALLFELRPGTAAGVPASKITTLAPWSTLTSADDPACRSDTSGYRAILQTKSPWVRPRGARAAPTMLSTVMMAQVRWSAARVCLEAIELPEGTASLPDGAEMQTMIIARFTAPTSAAAKGGKALGGKALGAATAGRLSVTLGSEVRQPLTCSLAPR